MFDYTQTAIKKMSLDLKRLVFIVTLVTQVLLMLYFAYAIYSGSGNLAANIVLAVLSVMYFVFFVLTKNMTAKDEVQVKKITAKTFKYTKLFVKAMTLAATLYGAVIALDDVTAVDIILIALSLVGWIVQVIFEAVVVYVEAQIEFIVLAFKMDVEVIKKPVTAVGDAFKKLTGRATEDARDNPEKREKLNRLKNIFKAEKVKAKTSKSKKKNERYALAPAESEVEKKTAETANK